MAGVALSEPEAVSLPPPAPPPAQRRGRKPHYSTAARRLLFDELQTKAFELVQQSWATTSHGVIRSARRAFGFFLEEMRQQGREDVLWQPVRWGVDVQASLHNELTFMVFAVWLLEVGQLAPLTVSSYVSLTCTSNMEAELGFRLLSGSEVCLPRLMRLLRCKFAILQWRR